MSNKLENNWKDVVPQSYPYERLNKHSDDIIKIMNVETSRSTSLVLDKLRSNPQATLIVQNQVTQDLFIAHHMEEASRGIGSSSRSLVCSQGWGSKATSMQLSSSPLSEGINVKCPSKQSLWEARSADDFSNLSPPTDRNVITFKFRPLMSLSSFLTKTILEVGVCDARDCSFLVLSACKVFFETINNDSNACSVKDSSRDVLSYLWATVKQKITHMPCVLP